MNKMILAVILSLPGISMAQGFVDEPTCYSWEGGHKSAGSFSKCNRWVLAPAKPAPVVAAPVVQVLPAPAMSCPPLPSPQARKHRPIVKPKPKVQC